MNTHKADLGSSPLTAESLGEADLQTVEARLLYAILQRLPDPNAPLAEAVEWETEDGLYRTTDKAIAQNWASRSGVRVIRRAGSGNAN